LNSFEAVTMAWLGHRRGSWTAGTCEAIEASLRNHAFPSLAGRPIKEIEPRELRAVVQEIEKTGARETAGRVFQRLRAIYRYAIAHDLCTTDPTYSLKPSEILAPYRPTHRAAIAERDVPEFLTKLAAYEGDGTTKAALQLLILTATRPGELRAAQWAEIDEGRSLWRIPGERMKMKTPHLVPLSQQAKALPRRLRSV
jgi:integrase